MNAVRAINVQDFKLSQVQDNLIRAVRDIQDKIIIDGVELTGIQILTTDTPVQHKLQRIPLGYIVISKEGPGDIYQVGIADTLTITLKSTVAVTANIWVF